MAAKKAHVPKFGNWGGEDNVPYTAYFDSARKSKAGGAMMNPNDPEQNPEAFMLGSSENDTGFNAFHAPVPQHNISNDIVSTESHQEHKISHKINNSTSGQHYMTGSQKSITSESSTDRSNSDNHHITRPNRKKGSAENISFYPPPSPGPNRTRNGHNLYDDLSFRSASVPIFGQWDEKDPTSGDGFTVIFNKVKEEKMIAASKLPTVPVQPTNSANPPTKDPRSKRCCCLF